MVSKKMVVLFVTILSLFVGTLSLTQAAYGAPPPPHAAAVKAVTTQAVHMSVLKAMGTDQHTCDDPDNPCYTVPQMVTYFHETSHRFYHLNKHFNLAPKFVTQAKTAHKRWCGTHSIICKHNWTTLKRLYQEQRKTDDGIECAFQTWWCLYHASAAACLGGPGNPYWSCVGGYHPPVQSDINEDLRSARDVVIGCKGFAIIGMIFGGLGGGLKGMVLGGVGSTTSCVFGAWKENQE